MRRFALPLILLLALVLVAVMQTTTTASPRGENNEFLPIVLKQPTPTPLPTSTPTPRPTATATPAVEGTGVFIRENLDYNGSAGTKVWGFVRFFDGTPAFGGEDNYHVYVDFECGGRYEGHILDDTGYYSININGPPATPLKCDGYSWLAFGPDDEPGEQIRLSEYFDFDTDNGSCPQMDWKECSTTSNRDACQFEPEPMKPTVLVERSTFGPDSPLACP